MEQEAWGLKTNETYSIAIEMWKIERIETFSKQGNDTTLTEVKDQTSQPLAGQKG